MARTPLVGVTSYVENARWAHWISLAALTPFAYVRALSSAGARPVQLPPETDAVMETLDAVDGLLVTGGIDVDPALYGADRHPEMPGARPERDQAELVLLEEALARDMPVLAICRGSQLLNVLRGGDIEQRLDEGDLHDNGERETTEHGVRIKQGSRLAALVGETAVVTSEHRQGLGRIGEDLEAVAWAPDGTVEALEDPGRRFALAVVWHPERSEDFALFRALVDEASRFAEERRA